jgi:hypothetical protein
MAADLRQQAPPPGKAAWPALIALGVGMPLLLAAIFLPLAPPDDRQAALLVLAGLLPMMLALGLLMRRRSVELEHGQLVIRAAFFTRRLPLAALDLDSARIVDLDEHTELAPTLRTFGYSLPGFHAGYYRIGLKQRAFCLLSDRRRVLVLRESDGRLLLLSLQRPQPLLEAMRQRAAQPSQRNHQ